MVVADALADSPLPARRGGDSGEIFVVGGSLRTSRTDVVEILDPPVL